MKRFYNNTIMSGAFSKALRVLALLCVLLGVSSSAWAGAGLVDVSFYFSTGNYENLPITGASDYSLGTNLTQAPKLDKAIIETWRADGGNTCGGSLYAKFDGAERTIGSMGHSGNNGNNQWWNWDGDETLPSTTGDHTIEFWIKVTGNENGNNCNQDFWASNNSQNYKFTYSIAGGGGGGDQHDKYYITGAITGGWGGSYWNEMLPTEDGKGHYYFWAQQTGDFKISYETNWQNDWWKNNIQVSNECTTITKDANGGNANLNTANVYIKYNPTTGYIWTEPVQCSQAPVYTVPEVVTIGVGESIDLSKICSSTSDATITFTKKSGTVATLNGTTLTAGQTAGTVVIKATQPLKTPYCSGSVEFSVNIVEKSIILLAEDAVKDSRDNWTLSAYLEETECKTIEEYGFFLCGTETNGGCVPTSTSYNIVVKKEGDLEKGAHFTGEVNASDVVSDWYGYRSYVKFTDDENYHLSSETRYFTDCNTVFGDTIYVTIDNTLTANSKCDFRFKSFGDAWTTLKTHKTICTVENVTIGNQTQEKITLVKPVVMQVEIGRAHV